MVKAGVIYTGKVNEQKCSVSLEAWAQNSDSILCPLLSVGQRKTQGQLRFKEWIHREALQTHIVKLVETENKELEDLYNP